MLAKVTNVFVNDLARLLCKGGFDKAKAEELSQRLHKAEVEGYQVSRLEDTLWGKLTEVIQRGRE